MVLLSVISGYYNLVVNMFCVHRSLPAKCGCPGGTDAWESSEIQHSIETCRNKTDICVTQNGNSKLQYVLLASMLRLIKQILVLPAKTVMCVL